MGHDSEPDDRRRQSGSAETPAEKLLQQNQARFHRSPLQYRQRFRLSGRLPGQRSKLFGTHGPNRRHRSKTIVQPRRIRAFPYRLAESDVPPAAADPAPAQVGRNSADRHRRPRSSSFALALRRGVRQRKLLRHFRVGKKEKALVSRSQYGFRHRLHRRLCQESDACSPVHRRLRRIRKEISLQQRGKSGRRPEFPASVRNLFLPRPMGSRSGHVGRKHHHRTPRRRTNSKRRQRRPIPAPRRVALFPSQAGRIRNRRSRDHRQ